MKKTASNTVASFIIAGATRSGTTTLWHYLRQHPEIFVPEKKELWFFNVDENYERGLSRYAESFRKWSGQKAVGDITPMYFTTGLLYRRDRAKPCFSTNDSAIARIARLIPDAKIILTLRNPVNRLYSQYQKNYYQGKKTVMPGLEEHIEHNLNESVPSAANFVYANRYSVHLAHVLKHFPREQVHIMIFEEWISKPSLEISKLFRFLGVKEDAVIDYSKVLNTSGKYRRNFLSGNIVDRIVALFKKPDHKQERNKLIPEMTEALRDKLHVIFSEDIDAVEMLLGRQVTAWKRVSEISGRAP